MVIRKDYESHAEFPRFQLALVAGYRRRRSLHEETVALIPLFLVIRALASIGWIDARPDLGPSSYASMLIGYVDRYAEEVIASFE